MERGYTLLQDIIALFIFWGLLLVAWLLNWPPSLHQLLGTVCGIVVGIVASAHHNQNWDWVQKHWHDAEQLITPSDTLGCLVPLASAAGVLTAKYGLVEALIGTESAGFLAFLILAGIAIFLSYLSIQDWRYANTA